MMAFEWHEPSSLKEALALLDAGDPSVRPIAGGTALMLMMKAGFFVPSRLVSLGKIEPAYSQIIAGGDGSLKIGAMVTLADLERSVEARRLFPVMQRALRTLSNVRVRNVACVGGALAHGDPHMDLLPLLAMLGARVLVAGPDGSRTLAVEDVYAGYYQTVLRNDELIAEVLVPPLNGAGTAYRKVTTRSADDWPALTVAVNLDRADGGTLRAARVVLGAASEKVVRLFATEDMLVGTTADEASLERAAECAVSEARFVSDAHGSAAYKKELLRVYLKRTIREAMA